jgi:RecT family
MARWEEFAPLKTVWVDNQPTDRKVLDKSGRWGDMPFLMLAKCAEAQAIRKGWPEDLRNTFVGEEIEQAALTLNPAQAAAEAPSGHFRIEIFHNAAHLSRKVRALGIVTRHFDGLLTERVGDRPFIRAALAKDDRHGMPEPL